MSQTLRIVFMGTPEFAVPALQRLGGSHHELVLVVTQPDRPKGRGRIPEPPPVKTAADQLGYPVSQPESVRSETFLKVVSGHKPDVLAVVAFGQILPSRLLAIAPLGAVNAHASLLPKYRGAAPIQWAIINGETHTGITTIQMDSGMDTGDILLSHRVRINAADTAETVHDRLADLGAALMLDTLDQLCDGGIQPRQQDRTLATAAPLLEKSTGHIDWRRPAEHIERLIRGVTPWPGAFTYHSSKRLKIYRARPIGTEAHQTPGTVLEAFPDELRVSTGSRPLSILEIQGASGKRLPISEFLRGYQLPPGSILH